MEIFLMKRSVTERAAYNLVFGMMTKSAINDAEEQRSGNKPQQFQLQELLREQPQLQPLQPQLQPLQPQLQPLQPQLQPLQPQLQQQLQQPQLQSHGPPRFNLPPRQLQQPPPLGPPRFNPPQLQSPQITSSMAALLAAQKAAEDELATLEAALGKA